MNIPAKKPLWVQKSTQKTQTACLTKIEYSLEYS